MKSEEKKSTYIGLYCKKCGGRERYIKGRRCIHCKAESDRIQYEKRKAVELTENKVASVYSSEGLAGSELPSATGEQRNDG